MSDLLCIYRERDCNPAFWAEPFNAVTNAAFLVAAAMALQLAVRCQVMTPKTVSLIVIAGTIGVGSFLFHTAANPLTMWMDMLPIALFQVLFLWLLSHEMLRFSSVFSLGLVVGVVGISFALMPIYQVLNGSLFYAPSSMAMVVLGALWAARAAEERYLLLAAAGCFLLAIVARSVDWIVPWRIGSHFLWHLLNGGVVYLVLRAWILNAAARHAEATL